MINIASTESKKTNPLNQGSTRNRRKGEMGKRMNTMNEGVGRNR